jgi:hypothetical protein
MPDERKDLTPAPERTEPYTAQEAEDLRKLLDAVGALEQSTNRQIGTLATCIRASFLGLSGLHERVFYAERRIAALEAAHVKLDETVASVVDELGEEAEEREALGIKLADLIDDEGRARRNDVGDLEHRVGNVENEVARLDR